MEKIKKMGAEHIYLIRGASCSNTPFFELESDCQLFLELADHYLRDYLKITSFQNNMHGWVMIICTESAAAIKAAYQARRALSKKCKKEFELNEVWQILSDQIRIFLSTYVKRTNRRTKRKGTKVRRRYERFLFDSTEEVLAMKAMLEEERYPLEQQEECYRPREDQSELRDSMIRTSIYMSCGLLGVPEMLRELGMACLDLGVLLTDVARQIIQNTLHHHFPT